MARVLITGFCALPGPRRDGVQLRHVVRALSTRHQVDVLVVREGDQGYVERQGTVRVLRVPMNEDDLAARVQAFQRALRRQLEGADYDLIHFCDTWSGMPVLKAQQRLGCATVFDPGRGASLQPSVTDEALLRDEQVCLASATLVMAPTEPAYRHLVGVYPAERIALCPPGVDIDRFDWEEPLPGPMRVLYVGPIEPGRGLRQLLRAMTEVIKATPAMLTMVGPIRAGFDKPLQISIAELGLSGHVEVRPPVSHDELPSLIASATVCVAPSAAEVTPRPTAVYPTKILEYMACKRAVVAPRRGAVAMLIDHRREGLLFVPGRATDLARKLVRLLTDPPLRQRLADAGYERVRREFTASGARRAIVAAYTRVLALPWLAERLAEGEGKELESVATNSIAVVTGESIEVTAFEGKQASDNTPHPGQWPVEQPSEITERGSPHVVTVQADDWVVAPVTEVSPPTSSALVAPPSFSGGDNASISVARKTSSILRTPTELAGIASGEIDSDPASDEFTALGAVLGKRVETEKPER